MAPPVGSLCAIHPDVAAAGTCSRCGAFGCETCLSFVASEHLCTNCRARQVSDLPSLDGRANLATAALGVTLASNVVFFVGEALTRGSAEGEVSVALMLFGLVALAMVPVFITTVVLFCRWFHLSVRYANLRGIRVGATPAGAVGAWFIPFANLVRPFDYTRAMLSEGGGNASLVGPWQTAWIVGNIATNLSSRLESTAVSLVALLIEGASAVLAIMVVREVTRTLTHSPEEASL